MLVGSIRKTLVSLNMALLTECTSFHYSASYKHCTPPGVRTISLFSLIQKIAERTNLETFAAQKTRR